jgi:cytochrome oxidase Cu insertion factor (SCO1/SenC/PrrC family)
VSSRSSLVPILIAAACLGPFVLALLIYYVPNDLTSNQLANPERTLLTVAKPLPLVALRTVDGGTTAPDWARYRWSLIYARITPCGGHCASDLARLTEVYLALGRNSARVQRVLLLADESFRMTGDPTLLVGYLDAERDVELVSAFGLDWLEQGRIFVVDPLGNLVMSYPPAPDQARLLEDLERLLDVSRIG